MDPSLGKKVIVVVASLTLTACVTFSRENWQPKQYYDEARDLIKVGSYTLGIDVLNKMQTKFSYGIYTEYAWLEKAHAYLRLGNSSVLAQIELDEFLRNYPHHSYTDYALFLYAFSEEAKIRNFVDLHVNDPAKKYAKPITKAIQLYQRLIRQHPNSQYTPLAQKKIIALKNILARREILIARTYQDLSAWVAAIKRSEYVLKNFPRSIYTDEALLLMQESYAQLGFHDIAKDIGTYYQNNTEKFTTHRPLEFSP